MRQRSKPPHRAYLASWLISPRPRGRGRPHSPSGSLCRPAAVAFEPRAARQGTGVVVALPEIAPTVAVTVVAALASPVTSNATLSSLA